MSLTAILVIAAVWVFLVILALAILRSAGEADRAIEERLRRPPEPSGTAPARRVRDAVLIVAVVPLATATLDATAAEAQAPGACAGPPAAATLCLVNEERRQRGLPALTANVRLARAARRHSADMVDRRYFSHVSPGGSRLGDRLRRAGYFAGCSSWSAGEALAWGTGGKASPASRVAAWMSSRQHRHILLDASFREAGIGVSSGTPGHGDGGATYTGEFARRRC